MFTRKQTFQLSIHTRPLRCSETRRTIAVEHLTDQACIPLNYFPSDTALITIRSAELRHTVTNPALCANDSHVTMVVDPAQRQTRSRSGKSHHASSSPRRFVRSVPNRVDCSLRSYLPWNPKLNFHDCGRLFFLTRTNQSTDFFPVVPRCGEWKLRATAPQKGRRGFPLSDSKP